MALSSLTSRINLYRLLSLSVVIVLCSLSYLIGLNLQKPVDTISRAYLPCLPTLTPSIDFNTHHTAKTHFPQVHRAPTCDPKYGEYTPCEDANRSLKYSRQMQEYRERHCPPRRDILRCLVPAPHGYRIPPTWPESRDSAWYANVPHRELTIEKADQNWVSFEGDRFRFPGGGTMFSKGADSYIDDIGKLINLQDGSIRTAIDTGCGVASWGAYLLSRNILTVSIAPRDTHEAQVQFAVERGVPALIGILATIRLPYPSRAFDIAHCSRCLIPWGQYDGLYLIELDRILRPGGYWILSGPPINWEKHWKGWKRPSQELKAEQSVIEDVTRSMCWKKIVQKGDIAIWQKPTNHVHCKMTRKVFKKLPFCHAQDPDTAWYSKLKTCLTPLPEAYDIKEIAGNGLERWPERLTSVPPRIISGSLSGITKDSFHENSEVWNARLARYKTLDGKLAQRGLYRNLLDMNAYLGGFAASIIDDPVWVMNIVPVESKVNTLGVIYERGLIGTYQNWCEAMSTYPRSYDFIHADSVFSLYKDRCDMEDILYEMDRILRPKGSVIIRDDVDVLMKVKSIVSGMRWDSKIVDHEDGPLIREKLLLASKLYWTAQQSAA